MISRRLQARPRFVRVLPSMLLSLLLAGAHAGHAADWLVIGSGSAEVLMLDRDSFRRSGRSAEALTLLSRDREIAATTDIPAHRSEISRLRFDCDAGTMAVVERTFFSAALGQGREVGRITTATPAVAASNQVEQMLREMACGQK